MPDTQVTTQTRKLFKRKARPEVKGTWASKSLPKQALFYYRPRTICPTCDQIDQLEVVHRDDMEMHKIVEEINRLLPHARCSKCDAPAEGMLMTIECAIFYEETVNGKSMSRVQVERRVSDPTQMGIDYWQWKWVGGEVPYNWRLVESEVVDRTE